MQPKKPKRIHIILLFVLIAAEAAFIALYSIARQDDSAVLLFDLYVAGILICAILIAFLLLTRVGPALLLRSAKNKLQSRKALTGVTAVIDPEGFKDRLITSLQKGGFAISETQITQSGGDMLNVTLATGKALSLFADRMFRYMIITEDFHKARDFDALGRYAQTLIETEDLSDEARSRSGFATVVVLLMAHVPPQLQSAAQDETVIQSPAYVPVACDMNTGKAYYLAGGALTLPEFRSAQRMIKKFICYRNKKNNRIRE